MNPRQLVTVFGDDGERDFFRMTYARARREKRFIVLCAICDEPARELDQLFPYHQEMNRCAKHKRDRRPLG